MDNNILTRFFDWFFRTMGNLHPVIQSYLLRVTVVLLWAGLLPALAFLRSGSRSILLLRLLFIVGAFIGGMMPIAWMLQWSPKPKSYLLTFCLLADIFLPFIISFFIVRTAGEREIVKWGLLALIALLFVANLFLLL